MSTLKITAAARLALGFGFFVFGLNGFLGFMPNPPHEGTAAAFLGGLGAAGYMFPLIKGTELVAGLLLLANRFVPLALTMLAPVVVNILAFHVFLEPASLAIPLVLTGLGLFVAWSYRDSFRAVLAQKSAPRSSSTAPPRKEAAGHESAVASA